MAEFLSKCPMKPEPVDVAPAGGSWLRLSGREAAAALLVGTRTRNIHFSLTCRLNSYKLMPKQKSIVFHVDFKLCKSMFR